MSAVVSRGGGQAGEEIVGADFRRDSECFAAVYDAYFTQVHGYVAARLGSGCADDLAAETFLVAFRRRAVFDPARGQVRAWLFGIATRLVARHRRDEARRYAALARMSPGRLLGPDAGEEDRIVARVSAQRLAGRLAAALRGLADGDRDVLLLVAVAQLTYQEVAAALDIPAGTVASRLSRARAKVREALGAPDEVEDAPWMS
ncbi:MAG: RNA polymerase sigma factor [Streptosporangiaceae bacterium]